MIEQERHEQQDTQQQLPRIYDVTDGVKSRYTKQAYRLTFNHFVSTIVKNPDLRVLLDYKPNVIESKIIDYIEYLKAQKLASSTIQVYCSAIFHFFDINDVNLNIRKIKRFLPEDESDHYSTDRPYSMQEIEQVLSKCDVRSKAAVLIMASTGMRIGGLRELRIGDIRKIDEFRLYLIWVYNRSVKYRYYAFCTPECTTAIDSYLEYRQKLGEDITKDKSPLIREQFNINNPFTVRAPRFLSPRMISFLFEDVLRRSGVNQIKVGNKRREVMASHGFRKFFITQCDKAGLNFSVREYLSGHRLPNQDPSYIRTTEEDRLAEYVKAIPLLTVDPTQRLKQENHDLKFTQAQEIAQLRSEIKAWESIKNQLLELAEKMGINKENVEPVMAVVE